LEVTGKELANRDGVGLLPRTGDVTVVEVLQAPGLRPSELEGLIRADLVIVIKTDALNFTFTGAVKGEGEDGVVGDGVTVRRTACGEISFGPGVARQGEGVVVIGENGITVDVLDWNRRRVQRRSRCRRSRG
jgi:hypothetical protein